MGTAIEKYVPEPPSGGEVAAEYVSPNPMLEETFRLIARVTGMAELTQADIDRLHARFPTPVITPEEEPGTLAA